MRKSVSLNRVLHSIDEVDSTRPDPRDMETEGQEHFVLLDKKGCGFYTLTIINRTIERRSLKKKKSNAFLATTNTSKTAYSSLKGGTRELIA